MPGLNCLHPCSGTNRNSQSRVNKKFPELDHADQFCLNAAEGWLGLGNWKEAEQELAQLTQGGRGHPAVLQLQCLLYSEGKKWTECAQAAEALLQLLPDDSFGWINRSYALRRAPGGSVQAAYDALLPAAEKAPQSEEVLFNLACYSCVLGRLDEARKWLKRCFEQANLRGRLKKWSSAALQEEDLKPLWEELKREG